MRLSAGDILKEIKLPDYKGRHVFTANLRLLIFVVFWVLSAFYFKIIWKISPFIPIAISLSFLVTGICYHNILKGRALVLSFLVEMMADLLTITLMVYLTGGEKSPYFTLYIIYCVAAGTFYSNSIALFSSLASLFFYASLVALLYFKVLDSFNYQGVLGGFFFLNLSLLAIFLPIIVYAVKIANHFSGIKERALEDRNKQLIALNRISSTIKGALTLQKAVRQVLSGVIEGLGYDICLLVVLSPRENLIHFHVPSDHALTKRLEEILGISISKLRLPNIEENSIFQAIKKNKIIFRQNLFELVRGLEPAISEQLANSIQQTLELKKFIITPLVAERRVVGAIIGATKTAFVEDGRVDVLENFANQAALAIETAQLVEELKQKNIDLEEASKAKSQFLAIMSHELRTPLTAVIGFSELLLEEVVGELNADQKEYLREVLSSSDHLLSLINSILDLSKVESGKMELHLENFDLLEVLKEVRNAVKPLVQKKKIRFDLEVTGNLELIYADERKVRQIFLNLVSNAIKFTPESGAIRLQVRYSGNAKGLWAYPQVRDQTPFEGGYFEIVIEDSGIGIQEKDMEDIFYPFTQVDSSYTRKYQGTGLGLTLTKQFVEMHHGVIWVESEFQKGTRFTIVFPKNVEEATPGEHTVADVRLLPSY
ncbi:MAG: GAF domain-containing sensor histidine kinase [Deltaproteobacteria bacterium]|nr:GAF domain-containing sensor histidine kinase [Deltaproteobacteria bacterium]